MKNSFYRLVIFITAILGIIYSCRHYLPVENGGSGTPVPVSTCDPDTVYFVNDIMPIIASNCTMSGCHDNITHADGINLTTYDRVKRYVVAGSAGESKLYKVIIKTNGDRMPPPPMAPLTQAQKDKIAKWINQGARNNSCIGSCDTAVFTYSGAVKPTIDAKCVGCHKPGNLGGNIDLSVHAAVKIVALNGKLYGSVAHITGYSPMPQNSSKLSDCEIRQIQKWINAGSPNN